VLPIDRPSGERRFHFFTRSEIARIARLFSDEYMIELVAALVRAEQHAPVIRKPRNRENGVSLG
jgi:hypothetical protein